MSIKSISALNARCSQCGSTDLIESNELSAVDPGYKCVGCGAISTLDEASLSESDVDGAASTAADQVQDALEKALSKMKW